jgi:dolichol-phosphate mannosyltransferase
MAIAAADARITALAAARGARPEHRQGPELSVVVPTFNERGNIIELLARLRECLAGAAWEVVFVDDDSPDGTADLVRELAAHDGRIRCIQRIGRRGLSSACVEGMLSSSAPYLAVIDADLQHDERLLPRMLEALKSEPIDIVIGSRYADGGDVGDWNRGRARLSRLATRLSRRLVPAELTDPMSGFFMMHRTVLTGAVRTLSNVGFKILTDLFASNPQPLKFRELSYSFGVRHSGESKFDSASAWDYLMLLLDKSVGRWVPVRFLGFSIVGAFGASVHFAVLALVFRLLHASFLQGQLVATLCAMSFNFAVNNLLTYRDRRLRGARWLRGWLTFMLACSIGTLMNLGLADFLFRADHSWGVAALGGILIGAVWNYLATQFVTWGVARR